MAVDTKTMAMLDEIKTSVTKPVTELKAEVDRINDFLDKQEADGRARINGRTDGPLVRANEGDLLTKSQRMASKVAGEPGDEAFRLGSFIASAVTGRRSHLNDAESKALDTGTPSTGGYALAPFLAAQVIDRARAASRVIEAGAQTLNMADGTVYIPRLAGGVSGAWRAENSAVSLEDPTFERVTLAAKTCAVLVKMSRELFEDISAEAFQAIEHEITSALALRLDYAAIRGAGTSNEPQGVRNAAGVTVTPLATNGATPTNYGEIVDHIANVWGANFEPTAALMSSRSAKTYAKLADTTGQPLRAPKVVEDLPFKVTNQIPNDLTTGTATGVTSEIYVADWRELILGVRPQLGIRTLVLNEAFASNLQIGVLAYLRADVALAHPAAFSVITGVKP